MATAANQAVPVDWRDMTPDQLRRAQLDALHTAFPALRLNRHGLTKPLAWYKAELLRRHNIPADRITLTTGVRDRATCSTVGISVPRLRSRWDLICVAHEIGHYVLHQDTGLADWLPRRWKVRAVPRHVREMEAEQFCKKALAEIGFEMSERECANARAYVLYNMKLDADLGIEPVAEAVAFCCVDEDSLWLLTDIAALSVDFPLSTAARLDLEAHQLIVTHDRKVAVTPPAPLTSSSAS